MKTFILALLVSGATAYLLLSFLTTVQARGYKVSCDDGTEYSMPMATKAIAHAYANTANAVCVVSQMSFNK